MLRRATIGALFAGVAALVVFLFVAWRPSIAPIEPPNPASFTSDSIAKGESLAAAAHCASCHTGPGGQPFAGGYGVNTPFGTIYGTNITPDAETGIGRWSLEAFTRAMREGVARDGSHLFGAFPYWAYTKLYDADVKALYAYFMTRTPVRATTPPNTVPFPLSIRALEEGWKILFFRQGRYVADPARSVEWNRGAYLAEAVSDCAGCHTPLNALGGQKTHEAYGGTAIDHWIAPALTEANPSPVPWTQEELFLYLRTGASPLHGATAATMTPVIRDALALPVVADSDVRAIASYFSNLNRAGDRQAGVQTTVNEALRSSSLGSGQEYDPDADLYAAACLSCHYNSGTVPLSARPELGLNSALTLSEPTNFIQAVLNGIGSTDGATGLVMPAYASSFSDAEVARLAAYLRRTRTNRPPWTGLENKVSAFRHELAASYGPR